MAQHASPPSPAPRSSASSSRGSSRAASLTLDLSSLPPHTSPPTPPTPSNTLLLTNLHDPAVFDAENLAAFRDVVSSIAPVHTWAPLRSFARVIVSFYGPDDAARVRSVLDGEAIGGGDSPDRFRQPHARRCRVYYGRPTPIEPAAAERHLLALPDAGRLFFISPPPSPPHSWQMRLEDAPNKQVHAEDLALALAKLHHHSAADAVADIEAGGPRGSDPAACSPVSPVSRSRGSTVIYSPLQHGSSAHLPAIAVEDTTANDARSTPPDSQNVILAHTARPPVELMDH